MSIEGKPMLILLYILAVLFLLLLSLALLIRTYGPTSSRRLKVGIKYRIKGIEKTIGEFKIHGKIYLMKDHILDDFYDLVKYSDYLLTKHNIPYTVAYGTLLGAVRNGGIMPWDDDADLYVHVPNEKYKDTILALKDEMESDGYSLRMNYDTTYFHVCKAGAKNNFPYIDWYQYYQTYSEDQLHPIKRMPFENFEVSVPNKHLECIDVVFNKNGKNDPMHNIVSGYPLNRYYSLWIVQWLKKNEAVHKAMHRFFKLIFPE